MEFALFKDTHVKNKKRFNSVFNAKTYHSQDCVPFLVPHQNRLYASDHQQPIKVMDERKNKHHKPTYHLQASH